MQRYIKKAKSKWNNPGISLQKLDIDNKFYVIEIKKRPKEDNQEQNPFLHK